ncbi:MAG: sigma-70 family RNA polymerase sigma factor [Phycisphaerales bacterium]|nr:sigma-70 family RNA polymerase sigma factor [Phycisphaerales bacterium]MCI0629566.1 sigma-70 family RNA polymerase sigma factor [Phycisphaerales bacterium]
MKPSSTHPSLLARLRWSADQAAWREFDARYGDLILRYCGNRGLRHNDAEDVRQMVMLALAKSLPGFRYDSQRGRFRSYLGQVVHRSILLFRHRTRPNTTVTLLHDNVLTMAAAECGSELEAVWEQEWIDHHCRIAMRAIRATYDPKSVEIFDRLLAGENVQEVAQSYGMSADAVHKVKQRIRDRMKELIAQQIRQEDDVDGDSGKQKLEPGNGSGRGQ